MGRFAAVRSSRRTYGTQLGDRVAASIVIRLDVMARRCTLEIPAVIRILKLDHRVAAHLHAADEPPAPARHPFGSCPNWAAAVCVDGGPVALLADHREVGVAGGPDEYPGVVDDAAGFHWPLVRDQFG